MKEILSNRRIISPPMPILAAFLAEEVPLKDYDVVKTTNTLTDYIASLQRIAHMNMAAIQPTSETDISYEMDELFAEIRANAYRYTIDEGNVVMLMWVGGLLKMHAVQATNGVAAYQRALLLAHYLYPGLDEWLKQESINAFGDLLTKNITTEFSKIRALNYTYKPSTGPDKELEVVRWT